MRALGNDQIAFSEPGSILFIDGLIFSSALFENGTLQIADLFGQDVIGLVDMRNQFLIKLRIISAAADGSAKYTF